MASGAHDGCVSLFYLPQMQVFQMIPDIIASDQLLGL